MVKKLLLAVVIVVILGAVAFQTFLKDTIESLTKPAIDQSKAITIKVGNDDFYNYNSIKNMKDWKRSERIKVSDYMKANNYILKIGEYKLTGGTTYNDALNILKFEKFLTKSSFKSLKTNTPKKDVLKQLGEPRYTLGNGFNLEIYILDDGSKAMVEYAKDEAANQLTLKQVFKTKNGSTPEAIIAPDKSTDVNVVDVN